jgi:hypothetical protein
VRRRRLAGAVGVTLVVAIAVAPAAAIGTATARSPSPCQRLKGRDVAPARFVKLVEQRSGALVGCVLPRGPVRRVASNGRDGDAHHRGYVIRQVVGRVVLVERTFASDEASSIATEVHDLRSGRRYTIGERCVIKAAFPCSEAGVESVPAAYVTAGARAVALMIDDGWGASGAAVVAFGSRGTRRLLDSGPADAFPPAALRLTGQIASWTNAGVPRGASLEPG